MSNPLGRLKNLPWQELLQIAALTNAIVIVVELFLGWGFAQSPIVRNILKLLYSSSLGVLIPVATAVGMGALAVYIFEQRQQQFLLNSSSLWALVVGLALKSLLPVPAFLVDLSETTLIGIVLGVFWKGRPYWR